MTKNNHSYSLRLGKSMVLSLLALFIAGIVNAQVITTHGFNTPGDLEGWSIVHKTGTSSNVGWEIVPTGIYPNTDPVSGGGLAEFKSWDIESGNSYELNSPALSFAGANYQVSFFMYRDNNSSSTLDKLEVYYNTVEGSEGGTLLGAIHRSSTQDPQVSQTGWYEYTFYIPGTPSGDGYISLLAISKYGYHIHIDELVVEEVPSCIKPTGVSYSNITGNSVDVSWTASESNPSSYEYYYSEDNVTPEAEATVSGSVTETSVSISGLLPVKDYYLWVRSVCSSTDKSAWAFGGKFTTDCGAISEDFVETFDNVPSYGELPNCWREEFENVPASAYAEITTTYTSGNSEDLYIKINPNSATQGALYLISPEFSNLDNNKQISVKMEKDYSSGSNDNNSGSLEFGIITDVTDLSTYVTIENIALSNLLQEEWKEFMFNTTSYTGAMGGYIAFKYIPGTSTYNVFHINDFEYKDMPSCVRPLNLMVDNISSSSATISWTAPENAPGEGYECYYSTDDTEPSETTEGLVTSTEDNVEITGLEPTTDYYVWTRSVCSDTDKSVWSYATSFKTACSSYTAELTENFDDYAFAEVPDCWTTIIQDAGGYPDIFIDNARHVSPPNSMRMYNSSDVSGTYYLISPILSDLNSSKEISFQVNREVMYNGPTAKNYTMEVGIMTDAGDVATYQTLQNITQLIEVGVWTEITINTLAYTGGQGHIVIKWNPQAGGDYNKFFISSSYYNICIYSMFMKPFYLWINRCCTNTSCNK